MEFCQISALTTEFALNPLTVPACVQPGIFMNLNVEELTVHWNITYFAASQRFVGICWSLAPDQTMICPIWCPYFDIISLHALVIHNPKSMSWTHFWGWQLQKKRTSIAWGNTREPRVFLSPKTILLAMCQHAHRFSQTPIRVSYWVVAVWSSTIPSHWHTLHTSRSSECKKLSFVWHNLMQNRFPNKNLRIGNWFTKARMLHAAGND
jgi:hypothetical protein